MKLEGQLELWVRRACSQGSYAMLSEAIYINHALYSIIPFPLKIQVSQLDNLYIYHNVS